MNGSFHISRIRLINFHNFVDETLQVRKNLFLIGENQSGKTTVLDAVHFALSGGVEMEFNAAARFGPRNEPGRSLASIVLRYDLERDLAQRGPSVMYAAVEIRNDAGSVHTFGAGAFTTSLDAQPDVWGFVARGKNLDEVGLLAEEADDAGKTRRRPLDRQELEETIGRGAVFDKGRYRTAIAQLLFRDRDAYVRALELVAAGKAYREMVARARNLDELFIGLLPPPAEAEFEEVRSALRAIEGIRTNLGDLAGELDVLRHVMEKLEEAQRETEKIARYRFVGAELERRQAAAAFKAAGDRAEISRAAADQAEAARTLANAEVASLEDAQRALRASEGAALLAREEEVRRDAGEAVHEAARAAQDFEVRHAEHRRALQEAAEAEAGFDGAKGRAASAIRAVAGAAQELVDPDIAMTLGTLAGAVAALEPGAPGGAATVDRPLSTVRRGFDAAREEAAARAGLAEGEAKRKRAEAQAALAEAEEVRRRAEVLPDLPGYASLLAALQNEADQAVPLYRLFALEQGAPETLGAGIECLLGHRVLGAIVAPPDQHAAAKNRVITHGCGIEIVDPTEVADAPDGCAPGTLPGAMADDGPASLTGIARAYLKRMAGDVAVLASGEPRGSAGRAVWSDGHIYEVGAEARVDPAAPRFLGAEARARAAAIEESRLRNRAEELSREAEGALEEANAGRSAADSCRKALELLESCAPAPLSALSTAVEGARRRIVERRAAEEKAAERLNGANGRKDTLKARHAELAAAIARAGISDLRDRLARMEAEIENARTREKEAIEAAGRARKEADERASDALEAGAGLETASVQAGTRRGELLPLVDPRCRVDLDDYVFRIMRGNQILPENVETLVQEASNVRARAFQWIDSSDGLRNERLWRKYAFRLDEQAREIRDQAQRPIDQVYEERDKEVRALENALDERTRDLLERVVMAGLVRRLQGQVRELRETIQGINRLAADLRFGTSRFQFSLRQRPEFQRLLDLLREQSVLQPSLREELRDFFQARLDDLRQAREGGVPEILDYRRWFEYVLQVQSRTDGKAQDLSRQRLRFGSTGEQAVPTYLLVLAVASLFFDRTDARLRLLLLDEAFLGIDAGRREVLMQFADRAGVDLIVATPELDGVTPALAASSTLFVEKTAEQEVFLSDYHWSRPGPQPGLFDQPAEPAEADLELGARPGSSDGDHPEPQPEDGT